MYAVVPRITPTPVIMAGIGMAGECAGASVVEPPAPVAFARPKIQHLHLAGVSDGDVGGLQVAMNDRLVVGRFQRVHDSCGDDEGVSYS